MFAVFLLLSADVNAITSQRGLPHSLQILVFWWLKGPAAPPKPTQIYKGSSPAPTHNPPHFKSAAGKVNLLSATCETALLTFIFRRSP